MELSVVPVLNLTFNVQLCKVRLILMAAENKSNKNIVFILVLIVFRLKCRQFLSYNSLHVSDCRPAGVC